MYTEYRPATMNTEKLKNLILFFVTKISSENLGKTKLFKLIFFADYEANNRIGYTISGDTYLKFPRGPVPKSASMVIKDMEEKKELIVNEELRNGYFLTTYKALINPEMGIFSGEERDILGSVLGDFGNKSRGKLVELSHQMESWLKVGMYEEMTFDNTNGPSPEVFLNEYKRDMNALSSE